MFASFATLLAASAALVSGAAIAPRGAGSASMTPHVEYSSSVGVLGCKINTHRVVYWPSAVSCDDICVKVSDPTSGRYAYLLKIDQSGGAYDMAYNIWNWLITGKPATEDPIEGGGVTMDYEFVDPSKCAHLLHDRVLPLSAPNSMDYLVSCLDQPDSWVAQNYALWNIQDASCEWGVNEECTLDLAVSNQPSCPSGLGTMDELDIVISNIAYGTGEEVVVK